MPLRSRPQPGRAVVVDPVQTKEDEMAEQAPNIYPFMRFSDAASEPEDEMSASSRKTSPRTISVRRPRSELRQLLPG
jgi:hypothetical protein